MLNQSGVYDGISWSVTQLTERKFELVVGSKTEFYDCKYSTLF